MNGFFPESIVTKIELEEIVDVKYQIISPQSSAPIISTIQDTILGSYMMTDSKDKIDWRSMMNILSTVSENKMVIEKNKSYGGKELFSSILPDSINTFFEDKETNLVTKIVNGELLEGTVGSNLLGTKKRNNLIHIIFDEYGPDKTVEFIDNITKISNNYNLYYGLTLSIGDLWMNDENKQKIYQMIETVKLKIAYKITEYENNPELMDGNLFEYSLKQELSNVSPNISKFCFQNLHGENNNLFTIFGSGIKEKIKTLHLMGCIGQQDYLGERILKNYNNRTCCFFFQNDDNAEARGFVTNSYLKGLNVPEFLFAHLTAREGTIDSAIKSVTGDTSITIMENNKIKVLKIGDWIDEHLTQCKEQIENYKDRDMELLKLKHEVYIPTTDEHGNVSWGLVTAITRHDPGKELFEIKTQSGRHVIVTESHSLLIWNENKNIFEKMLSKDVKIGNFVPVTVEIQSFPINDNNKSFNNYNSDDCNSDDCNSDDCNPPVCDLNECNSFYYDCNYCNFNDCITNTKQYLGLKFIDNSVYDTNNEKYRGLNFVDSSVYDTKNIDEILLSTIKEKYQWLKCYILNNSIYTHDKTTIQCSDIDNMYKIILLLNMFDILCEIKKIFKLVIICQWNHKLLKLIKHDVLFGYKPKYKQRNNVIHDKIISITKVDISKYPKVYDLTVPSTLNFCISNGLHVVDTAETGYIQKKMIKATEDNMIKYDGTVRNSCNRIQQFVYGDSGIDTTKQFIYKVKFLEMSNENIKKNYTLSDKELTTTFTNSDNIKLYEKMINMRDDLRDIIITATNNYTVLDSNVFIGVNLTRILNSIKNNKKLGNTKLTDPHYILKKIKNILQSDVTRVLSMGESEINDINSIKNKDDKLIKTILKYTIYDIISPKRCFINNLSVEQFDEICYQIIKSFNNAVIEYGEMVGIIAGQSMGECTTQLTLKSFHNAGISGKGASELGAGRIREVLSVSKSIKEPIMTMYFTEKFRKNVKYVNKIAAHIKSTKIIDIRNRIELYYNPDPTNMCKTDNCYNIFSVAHPTKSSCLNSIEDLPWLIRIEFNKDKMLSNEISLLDIKTSLCVAWEKRFKDIKNIKREKKQLYDKINQMAVVSNSENDIIPIIHIRFDAINYNLGTLIDFMDMCIDDFKLKGITGIKSIKGNKSIKERYVNFNSETGEMTNEDEYIISTNGININMTNNIIGVDLTKTYCNDITTIYEIYGIEAARTLIANELTMIVESTGAVVNQHIITFADTMTNMGMLTSIDRHGLNKLDNDPLSKASFEKTVEQLTNAAIYNKKDTMESVSSRIIAGLCIKGGTGACDLIVDKDMLKYSEYIYDPDQTTEKSYKAINPLSEQEINENVFIPTMF